MTHLLIRIYVYANVFTIVFHQNCKIDYELIAEDQICTPERSGDILVSADTTIEYCAQYCRSVSNNFIYGKNNKARNCYCQAGTRETGRCVLKDYTDYDLYEYRYPGKINIQDREAQPIFRTQAIYYIIRKNIF